MTIAVTSHPETTPPSCEVDLTLPVGSVMQAVAVYRNDSNGRTLLRSQPSAGFDSRTVVDYECPYEENVTYDWETTYTDPAFFTTLFNSTWASLTGWSQLAGTWNVSGGKVRATAGYSNLRRLMAVSAYRVTIASISASAGEYGTVLVYNTNPAPPIQRTFYLQNAAGVLAIGAPSGAKTVTTIDPSQPMTIDMLPTSTVVSGTGGTYTVGETMTMGTMMLNSVSLAANSVQFGAIKVEAYPPPTALAQTASPTRLEPADAWLVHPGLPDISMPLSAADTSMAGIIDIAPVEQTSNATVHKILGSSTPVPTTTGGRTAARTGMSIITVTQPEAAAMDTLLASDVPLLIQIPPSWQLDFDNGFYAVGGVEADRTGEYASPRRVVTFPLRSVQSPVVDVVDAGWTYADLINTYIDYASVLDGFASYADLASNTPI